MAEDEPRKFDVIIVGGGCSGLSAAYQIKKHKRDAKFLILEAKDRFGGRICGTYLNAICGKDAWDVGGQWVARSQPNIIKLLKELGLESYEQDVDGKKILKLGEGNPIYYNDTQTYGLSVMGALDVYYGLSKIESFCAMVPVEDPAKCPHAEEWDNRTVSEAMDAMFWTNEAKRMLSVAIHVIFGVEASQMSFLYFLYFCQSCGGCTQIIDTEKKGYAQEWKVQGGAFRVVEKLADDIGHENIKLSSPVSFINQSDTCVKVILFSGEEFVANRVIIAIPPIFKAKIHYSPPLPDLHRFLYERMPVGHLTKAIVTYPKRFWKEQGFSGEAAHWPLYTGAEGYPVCLTFDATSCNGSPALVLFIGGKRALDLGKMRYTEQRQSIVNSLILLFGKSAANPIDVKIKDWSKEPWNGGCPVSVMAPGGLTTYGLSALKEPFYRLHWAGTEAADCWTGYIDGAVQSGLRAANEVLSEISPNFDDEMEECSYYSVFAQQAAAFAEGRKSKKQWNQIIIVSSAVFLIAALVTSRFGKIWHWK